MSVAEVLLSATVVLLFIGGVAFVVWSNLRHRDLVNAAVRIVRTYPGIIERVGRPRFTFANAWGWKHRGGAQVRYVKVAVVGRRGLLASAWVNFASVTEDGPWRPSRILLAPWWPWSERSEWFLERDDPLATPVSLRE